MPRNLEAEIRSHLLQCDVMHSIICSTLPHNPLEVSRLHSTVYIPKVRELSLLSLIHRDFL